MMNILLNRRKMMAKTEHRQLPEGYVELQYLQCNIGQCLDTGVDVTETTQVTADVWATSSTTYNLYDVRREISGYNRTKRFRAGIAGAANSYWSFGQGGSLSEIAEIHLQTAINTKIHFVQNSDGVTVDGVTCPYGVSGGAAIPNCPLVIGAERGSYSATSTGTVTARFSGYIGVFIIRDNGFLLRYYVPCISPDNKVGFYDYVNETFHESDTSKAFIAGPIK